METEEPPIGEDADPAPAPPPWRLPPRRPLPPKPDGTERRTERTPVRRPSLRSLRCVGRPNPIAPMRRRRATGLRTEATAAQGRSGARCGPGPDRRRAVRATPQRPALPQRHRDRSQPRLPRAAPTPSRPARPCGRSPRPSLGDGARRRPDRPRGPAYLEAERAGHRHRRPQPRSGVGVVLSAGLTGRTNMAPRPIGHPPQPGTMPTAREPPVRPPAPLRLPRRACPSTRTAPRARGSACAGRPTRAPSFPRPPGPA